MGSRLVTDGGARPAAGDGGRHAPLAAAQCLLLTTFKEDGTRVSVLVRVAADGDRAYFQVWHRSGICKRLRHTDWVQVVPCSVPGLCSYGQALGATARLLAGDEARRAAGLLAREYPVRHKFFVQMRRWLRRWQVVHYELQADDPADTAAGTSDCEPN